MEDYTGVIHDGTGFVDEFHDSHVKAWKAAGEGAQDTQENVEKLSPSMQLFNDKLREAGIHTTVTKDGIVEIKGATEDMVGTVVEVGGAWEEQIGAIKQTKDGVTLIGEAVNDVDKYITKGADGMVLIANEAEKAGAQTITIKDGVISIGNEIDDINKKGGIDLNTLEAKDKVKLLETSIKSVSGVIETYLEWEAKIEIAKLEEDTKRVIASAESIRDSFVAAAEATSAAFGGLAEVSGIHFYEYLDLVERQLKVQEDLAAAQIAFTNEQTVYFKLRNDAMRRGDAASQVNVAVEGDMEGWLAGLIESLFKDIMVKASAESFSVLGEG